jgi:hypothetical protein
MVADGIVLGLFGLGLVLTPQAMYRLFDMALAGPASYVAGMWGALLLTVAAGYVLAAPQPAARPVFVQVGLARAVVELGVSLFYLGSQTISFKQAAAGMFLALWFGLAYLVLYPRPGAAKD